MWNNPKYTTGKIQSQGMEKSKVYAEADATTLMEAGIWTRMLPSSSCGTGSFDVVLFFVFVLGVNRQQKTPSGKRPAALWYTEGSETVKEERDMKGVTEDNVRRFLKALQDRNISATRRREMGDDIEGACGQLRRKTIQHPEGE